MIQESLANEDWLAVVGRLGGAEGLEESARETGALQRARKIKTAADLLRLVLAYCLGERGLRAVVAWAAAAGLPDISNPALLYRLRCCGDWLVRLIGQALEAGAPRPAQGRLIRLVDATNVPKAGVRKRGENKVWRVHGAFDLPTERFGCFELTDESGGEALDRIPVEKGEIRVGDRAYLQPERMAAVIAAGADVVVRAGWRGASWRNENGEALDILAVLAAAEATGRIDRPIWIARKSGRPLLALRLVGVRKPPQAAAEARRKAKLAARKGGHQLTKGTLAAADWVLLVTSLGPSEFTADDVLALYRLRWRVELGFKRLKSLVGLQGPPGKDPRSARPWVLAHLLLILLLEPHVDALEGSPPGLSPG